MPERSVLVPVASLSVLGAFLLTWELLPPALGVPQDIIPPASDLWFEMAPMWCFENLPAHILTTGSMALRGFVLGDAGGHALGLLPAWERVLSPYILASQIAPKVAFAPLLIMWFGFNAWPEQIVTILIVFFPILVNVLPSMRLADWDLVSQARAYSMSKDQVLGKVPFTPSMPNLMAGLRSGATLAVIGITVGEVVGSQIGLGYLITYGQSPANTAMIFNSIILLTLIATALQAAVAAVTAVEARVLHRIPRSLH